MNFARLKAVLFDMDGVLIDSEAAAFRAIQKTLALKGVDLPLEELIRDYAGWKTRRSFGVFIERYGFKETVDELLAEHYARAGNIYYTEPLPPFPGLVDFMDSLRRRGILMAVVSSSASSDVIHVLNKNKLLQYLDALITGDMVKNHKPNPEGYLSAMSYLGLKPGECLIIEDSPVGIAAGKSAGCFVLGYKGSAYPEDSAGADIEMKSYTEVGAWLRNGLAGPAA
jgi:HAD superfamily hydrolase (TIGR01509 family)